MEPQWLHGGAGYWATVVNYFPGQNSEAALLVETDDLLFGKNTGGKFLVLELRYTGDEWNGSGVVHVELCSDRPEEKRWQDRKQGVWIESHASYKKL